jgi:NADH-ubiquinone oxidoreductase chain 5
MLTGVGTDFWHNSLQTAPGTGEWISMHFLPSFVAWLPLLSVLTGFMLSISYAWPFPWFTESLSKKIYLFLLSRWQFDIVYNQQIARRVLDFGADTWKTLDKGLLELLGPKGVSISLMDYIIPSVRQTQTGAVHDYALVFLILALSGLAFIVMPVFFMPELLINNVVPRFIAILSLLYFFVI